jgi:hypothetical protein
MYIYTVNYDDVYLNRLRGKNVYAYTSMYECMYIQMYVYPYIWVEV